MAPKELRGMLSGFMQMAIVTGLLLAGICNLIVKDDPKGWRTTNSVAMIFPLIVMVGIFCVPESPRWMYKTKGRESAAAELKRLRKTENVNTELQAIGDALEQEGNDSATWNDLLHPSIRPRLFIAMFLQVLQQATGINPMFVYGGQIFESVASNGIISLFILQIVNFVSTIPAMHWVDRFGRRSLLLLGAMGMVAGHVVAGISFSVGCKGQGEKLECDSTAGWVMIIATAFFIFNFAISWGPVCWIYPAEIFPLKVRAKAVSASTMSNWTMGMLMMVIPKLFVHLGINGVFFLFGVLCAGAGLFVYFKCPETKGLLLEEIELLFNGPSLSAGKGIDGTPREMC
jgi:SP family sugar:H+ symporter-like MFS transporter